MRGNFNQRVEKMLGQILVERNIISPTRLQFALDWQNQQKGKFKYIGEILIEMRVPQEKINATLDDYDKRKPTGQILLDLKIITPDQLQKALERQDQLAKMAIHRPLAKLLVEMGYISYDEYMDVLSGHFNMPITSLDGFLPSPSLQQAVGDAYAQKHKIVVLGNYPEKSKLGLAEPSIFVMDELKRAFPVRMSLERLIMSISSKLIGTESIEIESEINHALKIIGEIVQADRSYIFSLSGKGAKIDKCHEWCEERIASRIKQMQGLSAWGFPFLSEELRKLVKSHAISLEIPQESFNAEKKILENQENQPVLLIPSFLGISSLAFLGFDSPRVKGIRTKEIMGLLQMFGEILVGALERKRAEEELKETKAKYRDLIENINDVIFSLDQNGYITYLSPVIESMTSYRVEEMMGQPLARFVHEEDVPIFLESLKRSVAGDLESFEFRMNDKKGNTRHLRISSRQLFKGGRWESLIGTLSDITEQKFLDRIITRAENQYRGIFENAVEGIFQCTSDGQFIVANPACARILGYASPEELITSHSGARFFADPSRQAEFHLLLKTKGMVQGFEHEVYRKDESKIWVSENARVFSDDSGTMFFYEGTMEDITEKKRSEEKIKFLSFHDKLTGLYSRAYFEEEVKRLNTERQLPISIILGDVNGLKLVNDAFGHQEGDRLLMKIAAILGETCRKEDLIARLGGDEFGIFLPKTNDRAVMEITNRIKVSCNNTSQGPLRLSIALGAVTQTDLSQDLGTIMKEAEERMYRNKLLESKSVRSSIISSLRQTLFEKSHETEEHTYRLQQLATQIGCAFELPDSVLDELALLATLHDIGKVAIPEGIILKPGGLSLKEWELVWKHPEIGYRIAGQFPELAPIAEAILTHHEWWNGRGYPRGLKGEDIPFISRIISIVDAYDAMIHDRPYREALGKQNALEELTRSAGTQFDPKIVEMFLTIVSGNEETCEAKRQNSLEGPRELLGGKI